MASPYKRRRPSLIRNLWVYRWLVLLAFVLGLMLWFIVTNNTSVTVYFPFRMGEITSRLGIVILLAALAGSVVTAIAIMLILAIRRHRTGSAPGDRNDSGEFPEDRPPADYAAKAKEGFSDTNWHAG
jgi:uncharacterized integral membrane protein